MLPENVHSWPVIVLALPAESRNLKSNVGYTLSDATG